MRIPKPYRYDAPLRPAAWLRGILKALPGTSLLVLADTLTRGGAFRLARGSCNLGVRLFPSFASLFRTQLAAVRSSAGDLDGGIHLLEIAMPEPRSAVHRDLHAGWFCEDHGEWVRAAEHYERVLLPGTPNAPTAEFQAWLRNHILELRRRSAGRDAEA